MTDQHVSDFRAKVASRDFKGARAIISQHMTGDEAEASTRLVDLAIKEWLPLQLDTDRDEKWSKWLAQQRQLGGDGKIGDADANGWSTIDTVPKNGAILDLWSADVGRVPECCWAADAKDEGKGSWVQDAGDGSTIPLPNTFAPTHWRYAPKDPVGIERTAA